MDFHAVYLNIIAGRGGMLASAARGALTAMSIPYGIAVDWRNRRFDSGAHEIFDLPVPVISVGNITTGGTGKTPLVMNLARRLTDRNLRPAIVSRGYKSAHDHLGDELTMISQRLPNVQCIANPNRADGAHAAIATGANVILLDDGFQHRQLARDLNIVVIDATNPFGFGHLLPRGLLRERQTSLIRADLVLISRSDLVDNDATSALVDHVAQLAPASTIIRCVHQPTGLYTLETREKAEKPTRAILFAAIGNPTSFEKTIRNTGIDVVQTRWWPDHHNYDGRDIAELRRLASGVEHDALLTTEKDAVKIGELDLSGLAPILVQPIDIAYPDNGENVLNEHLDRVLMQFIHD